MDHMDDFFILIVCIYKYYYLFQNCIKLSIDYSLTKTVFNCDKRELGKGGIFFCVEITFFAIDFLAIRLNYFIASKLSHYAILRE